MFIKRRTHAPQTSRGIELASRSPWTLELTLYPSLTVPAFSRNFQHQVSEPHTVLPHIRLCKSTSQELNNTHPQGIELARSCPTMVVTCFGCTGARPSSSSSDGDFGKTDVQKTDVQVTIKSGNPVTQLPSHPATQPPSHPATQPPIEPAS